MKHSSCLTDVKHCCRQDDSKSNKSMQTEFMYILLFFVVIFVIIRCIYVVFMDYGFITFFIFLTGMIITTTEGAARCRVAFYTVLSIGGGTIGIEQL